MIGMNPIIRLVELAVWSANIAGERNPVSMLLVAKPESGKSDIIQMFDKAPTTILVSDLTAWGLTKYVLPLIYKKGRPMTILIPDFLNLLSRNQATVTSMTQTLKSLMEEGITRIWTKFIRVEFDRPITGAVITSITPSEFKGLQRSWTKTGVLSRFIIVSYEHSNGLQTDIKDYLETRVSKLRENFLGTNWPTKPITVQADGRLLRPLRSLAEQIGTRTKMQDEQYGYRMQLHFQRLAAAHALTLGRDYVVKQDVEAVSIMLDLYANLDYNKVD